MDLGVSLIKAIVTLFDYALYPFYMVIHRPWLVIKRRQKQRAWLSYLAKNRVLYKGVQDTTSLREAYMRHLTVSTVIDLLNSSCEKYGRNKCLGTRRVLRASQGTFNGRPVKKVTKEDQYQWLTFEQTRLEVGKVSKGLTSLCKTRLGDRVLVLADTKAEWMITALSCFQAGCTVATLYTTMSDDAIAYGIQQTESAVIFTDQDLLPRLTSIIKSISEENEGCGMRVRFIVYYENSYEKHFERPRVADSGITLYPYSDLRTVGVDTTSACQAKDTALVMYTSGTTGVPKGVIFKHSTLIAGIANASVLAKRILGKQFEPAPGSCQIGFLPLAHIYEFTQELLSLAMGTPIAYSSPYTLTDASPGIVPGEQGDICLAKPSIMLAVPLVLERVANGIRKKVAARGATFQSFFEWCVAYKKKWTSQGFTTPLLDALVFRKVASAAAGGNLKLLLCGGAPLNPEVQEFVRICLCVKLGQGYGLTESNGGALLMDQDDNTLGQCGSCGPESLMMLENWEEGGYGVRDKDGPRGEILIGGSIIADGYFKCDSQEDAEAFFFDPNGKKWFRTGDIGQVNLVTNTISIIDRKKQLVKLQNGEYISLAKIETMLTTHPVVDMVCVVADPTKNLPVAVVVPDMDKLTELVVKSGHDPKSKLCEEGNAVVLEALTAHLKSKGCERYEIPMAYSLVSDGPWTPDTGLVTGAMKLRRRQIEAKYKNDIQYLYQQQQRRKP